MHDSTVLFDFRLGSALIRSGHVNFKHWGMFRLYKNFFVILEQRTKLCVRTYKRFMAECARHSINRVTTIIFIFYSIV